MGYIIGTMQTYCGFKGAQRIPCHNCKTENTWQKLSSSSFICARCRMNMSIDGSMSEKFTYVDFQSELDELEGRTNETD